MTNKTMYNQLFVGTCYIKKHIELARIDTTSNMFNNISNA